MCMLGLKNVYVLTFPSESVLHAFIISAPPLAYNSKQCGLFLSAISLTCN